MDTNPRSQDLPLNLTGQEAYRLLITMDAELGGFLFQWTLPGSDEVVASGQLMPGEPSFFSLIALSWDFQLGDKCEADSCSPASQSVRALVRRIRLRLPLAEGCVDLAFRLATPMQALEAGALYGVPLPKDQDWSSWLSRLLRDFVGCLKKLPPGTKADSEQIGRAALEFVLQSCLAQEPVPSSSPSAAPKPRLRVLATVDTNRGFIQLQWTRGAETVATGKITCTGRDELRWDLSSSGNTETTPSRHHANSIRAQIGHWFKRLPVADEYFTARIVSTGDHRSKTVIREEPPFCRQDPALPWLGRMVQEMAGALGAQFSPLAAILNGPAGVDPDLDKYRERMLRKEQRRIEEEERRHETMRRLAAEREQKEAAKLARRMAIQAQRAKESHQTPQPQPATPILECPPVPEHIEMPELALQDTALTLDSLSDYFLRERAAQWWVSNQSDDLISLPFCRIQRFDYQVRSALRVIGPLRGRALLSDEVGLGKTIEAGLALKEWMTRGMVRNFLVLTVPSLVDQWEEELADKFNLTTATTNHACFRSDAGMFWREHPAIIASLHTLKQPAHLEVAKTIKWDLVIVDEAHYLRNRESQAWQAVNALPRQFLLLLTATPVQNSLDELYNLVTLLQPGQLPSPKEFRTRFMDPKRPRQPREPEELRRLLGQVMIRNTRANAGINLPPRRAETVLFQPNPDEAAFREAWEAELRVELAKLPLNQQNLWGRLLLQAAGSSPPAWVGALEKFPNPDRAAQWRDRAPLQDSWEHKIDLLPKLARSEGGVVLFTQFLRTQHALSETLQARGVDTFVINGSTPATERQPITEAFQKRGGALLLTHSGTEGRNLQFCHHLVNFDLPWNPMEIEQRIGRLHRLGQKHPVRIYNLVQSGSLQEHLLNLLQEKLNLFELVVGETGLILGERFAGDEFADEILRRWRESEGRLGEAMERLGNELTTARDHYREVRQLDETLFAQDYESI
ncbi:MAG: hypothetical protein RI897_4509 [Verrucomicrobiota bacterium]|jgi:superfamily II DNA or RNA helicase